MRIRIGARFFPQHGLRALLTGGALGLAASGALAAPVPPNTNLYIYAPIPATGTVWDLDVGTTASGAITLPLGTPGLTINGNGNSITLTNGTTYGFFTRAGVTTFTLNNVALTGGNQTTGGSVISVTGGALTIPASGTVSFTGNMASNNGGAISSSGGSFLLNGDSTSSIELLNNQSATNAGGAIYVGNQVTIQGGDITLQNNGAQISGGAISANGGSSSGDVTLLGNINTGTVTLNGNHVTNGTGGAIRATGVVTLKGDVVNASNNTASSNGGVINAGKISSAATQATSVVIDGDKITLDGNTGGGQGGVIFTRGSVVIGHDASSLVQLNNNNSATGGGAIEAYGSTAAAADGVSVILKGSDIKISGNSTGGTNNAGGAIYVIGDLAIGSGASTVTLDGNHNDAGLGGALYAINVVIDGKSIALTGNSAVYGGAIVSQGAVTLTGAGAITGNTATTSGGAIYASHDVILNASGGDITFSGNKAAGQPNAIWLQNTTPATPANATFNTAGGDIVFFDPIASYSTNGLVNVAATGAGAVVFDGANNANESAIYGATTVAGGTTFTVRNGADYGTLGAGPTTPTSFTVSSGATLTGGGTGTVRANQFTLHGTLDVAGPRAVAGSFSTFDIAGVGIDMGGGTLKLNTCLNDASTQRSDVLNLTGSAITGALTLAIQPVSVSGCAGGATTGDGILLVSADSGSASLFAADTVVASAGGYDYKLVQVGNNWYLQSLRGSGGAGNGAAAIPAMTPATLAALALLLAGLAFVMLRRRV